MSHEQSLNSPLDAGAIDRCRLIDQYYSKRGSKEHDAQAPQRGSIFHVKLITLYLIPHRERGMPRGKVY